jgi:hypothetical protein
MFISVLTGRNPSGKFFQNQALRANASATAVKDMRAYLTAAVLAHSFLEGEN